MKKKSSAADRTVGMFPDPAPVVLVTDDVTDAPRQAETIEAAAERWRANAFFTQEHLSKHFNDCVPGKEKYRLTLKDGWRYLEQFRLDKSGGAYHYCGLMFADENLYELTGLLAKASREKAMELEAMGAKNGNGNV